MTGLFAHLGFGRGVPLTARREAEAVDQLPDGDCFPHTILWPAAVTPPRFANVIADQPSCDRPASSDFVSPFHSKACATARRVPSAGKPARLTRLRLPTRTGARATGIRFPQDDVQ